MGQLGQLVTLLRGSRILSFPSQAIQYICADERKMGWGRAGIRREQEEKKGGTGTGRDTREMGQRTLEGCGSWARGQGQ